MDVCEISRSLLSFNDRIWSAACSAMRRAVAGSPCSSAIRANGICLMAPTTVGAKGSGVFARSSTSKEGVLAASAARAAANSPIWAWCPVVDTKSAPRTTKNPLPPVVERR